MTIYVKKSDGGGLEVVARQLRLKAMLEVQGTAWVRNTSTSEQLEVHDVGGLLEALTPDAVAAVQSVAANQIDTVRDLSSDGDLDMIPAMNYVFSAEWLSVGVQPLLPSGLQRAGRSNIGLKKGQL